MPALLLRWLLGCALGGLLAALAIPTEFLGQLVLFGGLLSLGQAALVASAFRSPAYWALAWVLNSLGGWTVGSIVGFVLLPAIYDPAHPTVFDVLALSSPWALMSAGHAIVLVAFSGLRPPAAAAFALLWLVAGSAGGIAFTAAAFRLDEPFVGAFAEALGLSGFGEAVVAYPVLVATVYGVPTGVVLARVWVAGRHSDLRSD